MEKTSFYLDKIEKAQKDKEKAETFGIKFWIVFWIVSWIFLIWGAIFK